MPNRNLGLLKEKKNTRNHNDIEKYKIFFLLLEPL